MECLSQHLISSEEFTAMERLLGMLLHDALVVEEQQLLRLHDRLTEIYEAQTRTLSRRSRLMALSQARS